MHTTHVNGYKWNINKCMYKTNKAKMRSGMNAANVLFWCLLAHCFSRLCISVSYCICFVCVTPFACSVCFCLCFIHWVPANRVVCFINERRTEGKRERKTKKVKQTNSNLVTIPMCTWTLTLWTDNFFSVWLSKL